MKARMARYWDEVYEKQDAKNLGWYEAVPIQCLSLIEKCNLEPEAAILDMGAGASTLADSLLEKEFTNLILTDISGQALKGLQARLGDSAASKTQWIVADITDPRSLLDCEPIDLWHDRAVLHFLCKDTEKEIYLSTLRRLLKPGGFVIIAAFSLEGADKCTGLPVMRYDDRGLSDYLGDEFKMLASFSHIYHQPSGNPRPFVYTLFQRNS